VTSDYKGNIITSYYITFITIKSVYKYNSIENETILHFLTLNIYQIAVDYDGGIMI